MINIWIDFIHLSFVFRVDYQSIYLFPPWSTSPSPFYLKCNSFHDFLINYLKLAAWSFLIALILLFCVLNQSISFLLLLLALLNINAFVFVLPKPVYQSHIDSFFLKCLFRLIDLITFLLYLHFLIFYHLDVIISPFQVIQLHLFTFITLSI